MDELKVYLSELKMLLEYDGDTKLKIGEILFKIKKHKLYYPAIGSWVEFLEDKSIGMRSIGLSPRTCHNYLNAYIAFSDIHFRKWFNTDFQNFVKKYKHGPILINDIFLTRDVYEIVSKYKKDSSRRNKHLKTCLINQLKKRKSSFKNYLEKKLKQYQQQEERFQYTEENEYEDDIPEWEVIIHQLEEKAKQRSVRETQFIGDIRVSSNFRSEIKISPVKGLIRKEYRNLQMTPELELKIWKEDVKPLLHNIYDLIEAYKSSMGYTINEPQIP